MGPVEILFVSLTGVFGIVGIVRGYARELGVTTMLLIALFVLSFLEERFAEQVGAVLTRVGVEQGSVDATYAWIACAFLTFIVFITYQGVSLTFPGKPGGWFLGMVIGLINGYLYAGSAWYYLARAQWPLGRVLPEYSDFYNVAVQLLPPKIMSWPYFIGLAVVMLILRALK